MKIQVPIKKIAVLLFVLFLAPATLLSQFCSDTSLRKLFWTANGKMEIIGQYGVKNNESLVIGRYLDNSPGAKSGLAIKFSSNNSILWAKTFSTTSHADSISFNKALGLKNGDHVLAGSKNGNQAIVARLTSDGVIRWTMGYEIPELGNQASLTIVSIEEQVDNDLLITVSGRGNFTNGYSGDFGLLLRIRESGNIVWSTILFPEDGASAYLMGSASNGTELSVWAHLLESVCPNLDTRSFRRTVIDYATGQPLSSSEFCFEDIAGATSYSFIYNNYKVSTNGLITYISGFTGERNRKNIVAKFEAANNTLGGISVFHSVGVSSLPPITTLDNGDIVFVNKSVNDGSTILLFTTITGDGQVKRQRVMEPSNSQTDYFLHEGGQQILVKDESSFSYVYGFTENAVSYFDLMKLGNSDPKLAACLGTDTSFPVQVRQFNTGRSASSWNNYLTNVAVMKRLQLTSSNLSISETITCLVSNTCEKMGIDGEDSVCVLGQLNKYTMRTNGNCNLIGKFEISSELYSSFQQVNDTLVRIQFKPVPEVKKVWLLFRSLTCPGMQDSLLITLFPSIRDLGIDTTICAGESLRISPGNWFKSYKWQDGSGDSTYTVVSPGTYFIRTETYCGQVLRDTIHVIMSNPGSLSQVKVCALDTVTLYSDGTNAGSRWTPVYRISNDKGRSVVAYPLEDIVYYAHSVDVSGCVRNDTFQVKVYNRPFVSLGPDTNMCAGDRLYLNAGTLHSSYLWSTGETTREIVVSSPGNYLVQAWDQNGCDARDSIAIGSSGCVYHIYFPNAFSPNNDNRNELFRPVIKGGVVKYSFSVYNRFGQLVFKTSRSEVGWNGVFNGVKQPFGTYSWVCSFQFHGQVPQIRKGIVQLIR